MPNADSDAVRIYHGHRTELETLYVRLTPLLKTVVALAVVFGWAAPGWAAEEGVGASTLVEATRSGGPIESTFGGPAAEFANSAAGSFDPSILLVLVLGTAGLIWVRKYVRSL